VQHGKELILFEQLIHGRFVRDVKDNSIDLATRNGLQTIQTLCLDRDLNRKQFDNLFFGIELSRISTFTAVIEVVDDENLEAGFEQLDDAMRAYVARAARH
jgi:hypothetical protein